MVTVKGALRMEEQLYGSVSKEFIKTGGTGTADDEAYYKAFSAVQKLREYLEEKENHEKNH
jgi:hypothetical protein